MLTWTAATDIGGSGLAGYAVYRDATLLTARRRSCPTPTAAAPDGVFTYTVRAFDGAGNRGTPSPARTVQLDRTPPDAADGPRGAEPRPVAPRLTWTPTSDADHGRQRRREATASTGTACRSGTTSSPVATSTTRRRRRRHLPYSVAADRRRRQRGRCPRPRCSSSCDGTPPPVPLGLSVAAISTITRPVLTWVSRRRRTRCPASTTTRSSATASSSARRRPRRSPTAALPQNGSYAYAVRAVDVAGATSAPSISRAAIWDNTPPEVPVAASPSPSPTNRPTLTWAASTDTGGAGGVVYHVLRDGTLDRHHARRRPSSTRTRCRTARYTYRVVAIDAAANTSGPSRPAAASRSTPRRRRRCGTVAGDSPTTNRPTADLVGRLGQLRHRPLRRLPLGHAGRVADHAAVRRRRPRRSTAPYAYTVVAVDNAGNVGLAVGAARRHLRPHRAEGADAAGGRRRRRTTSPALSWPRAASTTCPASTTTRSTATAYRSAVTDDDELRRHRGRSTSGLHVYTVRAYGQRPGTCRRRRPPQTRGLRHARRRRRPRTSRSRRPTSLPTLSLDGVERRPHRRLRASSATASTATGRSLADVTSPALRRRLARRLRLARVLGDGASTPSATRASRSPTQRGLRRPRPRRPSPADLTAATPTPRRSLTLDARRPTTRPATAGSTTTTSTATTR